MPKDGQKICEQCDEVYFAQELKCPSCDYENRPNVALAALKKPKAALERRYTEALQLAETNGSLNKVKEFETLIKSNAKAVVNLDISVLEGIINGSMRYINTYQLRKIRTVTKHPDGERRRFMVDGFFFPNFGDKMAFAALALDGIGIRPYGNCTITLKEKMIAFRASLLEDDSFQFFEKLENRPAKIAPKLLNGYIATWEDKHKLAVAKLADQITPDDTHEAFAKLLLNDEGKMSDARFIEIHVFGFFNAASIESFSYFDESTLPKKPKDRKEELLRIQELKKRFQK